MGRSFRTDRPVVELILERYPATIQLAIAALLIAIVIAIPLGVIAGKNRGTWIDNLASVVALIGISLPGFVIGPLLVYVFAVKLGWLAPSGRFDWTDFILPSFTLGAALSAILTRMVRSSVIEELGEDYVRTARAKGLSETQVVYKHVLKNGLIPVVTILGLQLGVLLAGAIITEENFWLARIGPLVSGGWDWQARLPRRPGVCAGDKHYIHCRQHAHRYDLSLAGSPNPSFLTTPLCSLSLGVELDEQKKANRLRSTLNSYEPVNHHRSGHRGNSRCRCDSGALDRNA